MASYRHAMLVLFLLSGWWYVRGPKESPLRYEYSNATDHRIVETKLCDASLKQHAGYFDISQDKHVFFWFFEAQEAPEEAPVILWLSGGPGCSASIGLFFEMGPCKVVDEGNGTIPNPYAWTKYANVIFIDQPVNVGYSYSDKGKVTSSATAAEDVYAFLQLFFGKFNRFAKLPLHVVGESYGGTYGPNVASVIFKANQEIERGTRPNIRHLNLASVVLENGYTDPYTQIGSVADYACDGPFPIYSDPNGKECATLRSRIPTCQRFINSCYKSNLRAACVAATVYCGKRILEPVIETGINPYDVRLSCDPSTQGALCYEEFAWIDGWMNQTDVKKALGVDLGLNFETCRSGIEQGFILNGDAMHNSGTLLQELIDGGVRLLVYSGNADVMCNYIGGERWVEKLKTSFSEEFLSAKATTWVDEDSDRLVGTVRSAGGGGQTAGNITFVTVFDAGHFVAHDQPKVTYDLILHWLWDVPFDATEERGSEGVQRVFRVKPTY